MVKYKGFDRDGRCLPKDYHKGQYQKRQDVVAQEVTIQKCYMDKDLDYTLELCRQRAKRGVNFTLPI